MTAVAPPLSIQPLPRWNSRDGPENLDSISAEEVTRIFMPRKSPQRQDSSASSSMSSTSSTILSPPMPAPQVNGELATANSEQGNHVPKKKVARGLWPSSKAEPVSGVSTARPQGVPTSTSGQSAASTMNSAINPNTPATSSQVRPHSSQSNQNGNRVEQHANSTESTAILALLPITGLFERKQIVVPFSPEILRIGRQTNAKTVPTATNGYFDSKVLSRQHAEVWADRSGKIWIRDVKSSNGTFVNGVRLSPENRESEPHELREQDTLELGIDIVSEDQKSIVHHKVSAKIELAGIYSSTPTLVDMIHVDPSTGQQYSGDPTGQPLSQIRGRAGHGPVANNGRLGSLSSVTGGGPNVMGAQRQMNMWMAPITVEQVVRKLTTELKQAKQQSRDLNRTKDFFGTLMALEPGQEPPKSPQRLDEEELAAWNANQSQEEHRSPEAISPFSHPPAPPPQQPLPEKPDLFRFTNGEVSMPSFRRTETEKPKSPLLSPNHVDSENGQILSLLEALKVTQQESGIQEDRIKNLEAALKRERKARELAERRVNALSGGIDRSGYGQDKEPSSGDKYEPPLDSVELMHQDLPSEELDIGEGHEMLRSSASMETLTNGDDVPLDTSEIDSSTARLQARLDLMVKEMEEMKNIMESYKRRAEDAEESRRSLAQMVEDIRAGQDPAQVLESSRRDGAEPLSNGVLSKSMNGGRVEAYSLWSSPVKRQIPNGHAGPGHMQHELEDTFSNILQQRRGSAADYGRMAQSVPYVSMVGVVIVGVGIMTWLNGWQPGGDR